MGFKHGPGRSPASSPVPIAALHRLVYVVFGLFLLSLIGLAGTASATVYTPPTSPFTEPSFGSYGCEEWVNGENKKANETTERILWISAKNQVTACKGAHQDAERIASRLFWVTEELLRTREKVEELHTDNGALKEKLETLDADLGTSGSLYKEIKVVHEDLGASGAIVKAVGEIEAGGGGGMSEEQFSELVGSVDAGAEGSQGAIYFVAGLLAACFLGYCLWRTVEHGT